MTTDIKPIYAGEAQLVRWADSGAAGRTITLRIDESDTVHPFRGLKYGDSGQRFEIAVVAKNDDEEPLDADHAKKNAKRHKARPKDGYTRSQMAAILCRDHQFQSWILWGDGPQTGIFGNEHDCIKATDEALKRRLSIISKKDLDRWPEAGEAFDKLRASFDVRDMVRR